MKQKHKILLFCTIIVAKGTYGQQYDQFHQSLLLKKQSYFTAPVLSEKPPKTVLPANFYCTNLGFFCKKELKLESVTGIPFRFRLGSLQYNDWLEGKKIPASASNVFRIIN